MDHPFKPGTKVAVWPRFDGVPRARLVAKVYKTGRFTLCGGGAQQWTPREAAGEWRAWESGPLGRESLTLWGDAAEEAIAAYRNDQRRADLVRRLIGLSRYDLTDAMLDAIEAALPRKEGE